jgi:signal-transduction protein with cAMP-binding, CBS, and nucleotidyltransferase domain
MTRSGLADWLLRTVGEVAEPVVVLIDEDEPVIDLIARLRTTGADTAVIVDATGAAIGLIGARDILDRVVSEVWPEQTIRTLLVDRPPLIRSGELLYRAIGRMQRDQRAALVVVDESRKPCGLLRWHAVLAAGFGGLLSRLELAAAGDDVPGLAETKAAQAAIAKALLAEHQPATEVLRLINVANLDIIGRLVPATIDRLSSDGWGEPPVAFAMIVMGSAGRGESLLNPDQDNGLILADYPDSEHALIDSYFIELAERLTRDLAAVGFPLCTGNVMVTNPVWRKTLSQWYDQISGWTRRRTNLAILSADIFFDFRAAYGAPDLVAALRRHATSAARDNPPFLNQLVWQQAEHPAAIGLFGRLLIGHDAKHTGAIDLKLNGLVPVVELVRLLALKAGIAETGTLARLAAVREAGLIGDDREAELAEAFTLLIDLLLHQQLADWEAGRTPGNHVMPADLPRWQRDRLVETLRSIESFKKRVIGDMLGASALGPAG